MSDDLVKRARHNALADMPHYASVELIEAMADRIEELAGQLREARMQSLSNLGQADEVYKAQLTAEAKLAKAVEALEYYRDYDQNNGYRARVTLEEMKSQE